jgi:hypothetical protein
MGRSLANLGELALVAKGKREDAQRPRSTLSLPEGFSRRRNCRLRPAKASAPTLFVLLLGSALRSGKLARYFPPNAYTTDALAKFLGEVNESDGKATESFKATFGALELIDGNGLKESDVAGLEVWKIDAPCSSTRLREVITATLEAYAAGKITLAEMPIDPKTNKTQIRYAPGFSSVAPGPSIPSRPYTVDGLAKFLGEVDDTGHATHAFKAAFAALEF